MVLISENAFVTTSVFMVFHCTFIGGELKLHNSTITNWDF